jgi:hypothetical protein
MLAQREGGMVRRCHTMPHVIGTQDNAQHSFNMLILAYGLHPNPSPELIRAITFHDLHERYAGDLPAAAKKLNPDLRSEYMKVCTEIDHHIGTYCVLSAEDHKWLKALDGLEFWLWCNDQMVMGNRSVYKAERMQYGWLVGESYRSGDVPEPVFDFIHAFRPEPGPHAI